MPAESILSPNRPHDGTNVMSKVTMWGLDVDERDKMRPVSALADPRDAMGATAPHFKFDFVAIFEQFLCKILHFCINRNLPSPSDSISVFFLAVSFEKLRIFLVHILFQNFLNVPLD